MDTYVIPKGTTILEGSVAPNFGQPGGGFWDHKTEMVQSYDALQSVKKGLEGSLQNPNIDSTVKLFLQEEIKKANSYINQIEDLFRLFGGVK